ncbi:MAG: ABC transporter ATP-binding protein [Anaerolineales bacterium]
MRVKVDGASFVYPSGVRALDEIHLEVRSGETVAIVGENGAGKTTLVKLFNGLLRPTTGRVLVGNWDVQQYSTAQLAARVGFLFQNPDEQLFERSAEREVAFGPRNLGFSDSKITSRTRIALQLVGLLDKAQVNPYDMQPFERKLLALASTLAMETPVLVLDEPSIGQDAAGRQRIRRILAGLHKRKQTLLLISHDLDFCAQVAKRGVVMAGGRILADGPISDVFAQAKLLGQAAVSPPQLIRLAQGLKMPGAPLTPSQFVKIYSAWRSRRKRAS